MSAPTTASGARWWLVIALLLSVGVNVGIVSMLVIQRLRPAASVDRPAERTAPTFERAANRLRLQGEKRDRFLAIHREFMTSLRTSQDEVERLRRALRQEMSVDRPDEVEIKELLAELGRAYAEMDATTVRTVLASRRLLEGRQERAYLRMLARLRTLARGEGAERRRALERRRPAL